MSTTGKVPVIGAYVRELLQAVQLNLSVQEIDTDRAQMVSIGMHAEHPVSR